MRTTLAVAVAAALFSLPAVSQAQSTESAIKGSPGRYGSAGCGLGSMAFGNQPGAIQNPCRHHQRPLRQPDLRHHLGHVQLRYERLRAGHEELRGREP